MSLLEAKDISVRRGGDQVLNSVSISVSEGECVGLLGPNGSGKTSLFQAMLGLLSATGESNLARLPQRARARAAAWMPQSREIAWPIPVETLVMLGRLPHLGAGARVTDADRVAVDRALARMDLSALAKRPATELSGGEQARVLIARVLAQDTPLILADEPVAGLDPAHQITAMDYFRTLADEGRGILVSMHDLGLAARFCTRVILLHDGQVGADGPPEDVLVSENLARVFGVEAYVANTPGGLVVQPQTVLP